LHRILFFSGSFFLKMQYCVIPTSANEGDLFEIVGYNLKLTDSIIAGSVPTGWHSRRHKQEWAQYDRECAEILEESTIIWNFLADQGAELKPLPSITLAHARTLMRTAIASPYTLRGSQLDGYAAQYPGVGGSRVGICHCGLVAVSRPIGNAAGTIEWVGMCPRWPQICHGKACPLNLGRGDADECTTSCQLLMALRGTREFPCNYKQRGLASSEDMASCIVSPPSTKEYRADLMIQRGACAIETENYASVCWIRGCGHPPRIIHIKEITAVYQTVPTLSALAIRALAKRGLDMAQPSKWPRVLAPKGRDKKKRAKIVADAKKAHTIMLEQGNLVRLSYHADRAEWSQLHGDISSLVRYRAKRRRV